MKINMKITKNLKIIIAVIAILIAVITSYFLLFSLQETKNDKRKTLGKNLVVFYSSEGINRFEESDFKDDFYQLVNFYQSQINPLYCSAATGSTLVNAIKYNELNSQKVSEVKIPTGKIIEFPLITQQGFFNEQTNLIKNSDIIHFKKKNSDDIYDPGLSLDDFAKILTSTYQLNVIKKHISKNNVNEINDFRRIIKEVLSDKNRFIAVNFNGKIIGNKTGGHISLIGAYHEKSDSVLILDTALHKNPWYFVDIEDLFTAMNSVDFKTYRGYLIINK